MSNIRTVRDLPSNSKPAYIPLDVVPTKNNSGSPSTSANSSPGINSLANRFSCKEELKRFFCSIFSDWKFLSFTFICTMVQIAVYIYSEVYTVNQDAYEEGNYDEVYTAYPEGNYDAVYNCVLYKFGAAHSPSLVVYYQLYRLVTPMFLHGNVGHIFANVITQWSLGFKLEAAYGTKKLALMWFLTGISGSLLSGVAHQWDICFGASTAGCGLIAWWWAHVIDNYSNLGPDRKRYTYLMAVMLVWGLYEASMDKRTDNSGHAGGFIGGILLSTQFMRWTEDEKWRKKQKIALGLWILYVVGICLYFAVIRHKLESRADHYYKTCSINMNWF